MESSQSFNTGADPVKCENCNTANAADKKFCSECSYPIAGDEGDKRNFRIGIARHKQLLKNSEDKIRSAKTIIYILAGLFFISGIIYWSSTDDIGILIINLFICLLYLIFAAWSSSNPFGAILTAFIVYVTVHVMNAFIDPSTIGSGIILKIVFVAAFIKGIRSALEARTSLKELEKFKAAPVETY